MSPQGQAELLPEVATAPLGKSTQIGVHVNWYLDVQRDLARAKRSLDSGRWTLRQFPMTRLTDRFASVQRVLRTGDLAMSLKSRSILRAVLCVGHAALDAPHSVSQPDGSLDLEDFARCHSCPLILSSSFLWSRSMAVRIRPSK